MFSSVSSVVVIVMIVIVVSIAIVVLVVMVVREAGLQLLHRGQSAALGSGTPRSRPACIRRASSLPASSHSNSRSSTMSFSASRTFAWYAAKDS